MPEESEKSCNSDSPYIFAMEWLFYVPGIKCRLWVMSIAYFVIHVKQTDDIFSGISKLDYLLKISVF